MSASPGPLPIARLYRGKVFHVRMKPKPHRFSYRVFSVLLDVDRLDDIDRLSGVFSVGRWNLLAFHPSDHGPRDGSPLRAHVDDLLRQAGVEVDDGRVFLLCAPRVLGFVFNPLSIYWRIDGAGALRAIVYEVRNTFGESHSYVGVTAGEAGCDGDLRQSLDKRFFVSPFLDMKLTYRFRLRFPDDALRIRILETDDEGPVLAAGWSGRSQPFDTPSLLSAFVGVPLLTIKIIVAIHWEGIRLWWKGVALRPRPTPPESPGAVERRLAKTAGPRT